MTCSQTLVKHAVSARKTSADMAVTEKDDAHRRHVLVLGRAKTGTTFVAKSIQATCPDTTTHFVMEPRSAATLDREMGPREHATVVMKVLYDHFIDTPDILNTLVTDKSKFPFHTIVSILRDPRDELVSRLMYRPIALLMRGKAQPKDLKAWIDVLKQREQDDTISFFDVYNAFNDIYDDAVTPEREIASINKHCIAYADFLERHASKVRRLHYEDSVMDDFIAIEPAVGWQISTTHETHKFDYTKRSSAVQNWPKWFHSSDIDKLQPLLGRGCERLGYPEWALPVSPDRTISPAQHSGYAQKALSRYYRRGGPVRAFVQNLQLQLFG